VQQIVKEYAVTFHTTSSAAQAVGMPTSTLIALERAGKVGPFRRDAAGRRLITEGDLEAIRNHLARRAAAVSIAAPNAREALMLAVERIEELFETREIRPGELMHIVRGGGSEVGLSRALLPLLCGTHLGRLILDHGRELISRYPHHVPSDEPPPA
jgi:hypothetical protein